MNWSEFDINVGVKNTVLLTAVALNAMLLTRYLFLEPKLSEQPSTNIRAAQPEALPSPTPPFAPAAQLATTTGQSTRQVTLFRSLLAQRLIEQALDLYLQADRDGDSRAGQNEGRCSIRNWSGTWTAGTYQLSIELAAAWLAVIYDDLHVLGLQARALQATGDYAGAIQAIYSIQINGEGGGEEQIYHDTLRMVVADTDAELAGAGDYARLLAFYDELRYWDVDAPAHRLRMAELYLILKDTESARELLDELPTEPAWQAEANDLLERLAPGEMGHSVVALHRHSGQFLVDVGLNGSASVSPVAGYRRVDLCAQPARL